MFIPLRTDRPLRHTPYVNYALILANIAVYLYQVACNPAAPADSSFTAPLILQPADPHLWQYFTYAFLHANLLHIALNMLFLYIFGNNINDRLGNLGYLAFYLAGAVFAGVGYVLFDRNNPVLGASGAIAAVTGAYLILLPRSNITVVYFFFFVGVTEIASLWFVLFFFALDLLGEIAPQYMGGTEAVAHAAHISGTLYGIALCTIFLAVGLLPRDPFDVVALAQRWNRRRQYRDLVSTGYDPFGHLAPAATRKPSRQSAQEETRNNQLMELRGQVSLAVATHELPKAAQLYQELIALDPSQTLSRNAQLDIANYLASQQAYTAAVAAYENFAKAYANYEQIEQVHLMLGVIYSRYLNEPAKAKEFLLRALAKLHAERDVQMAKAEMAHIATLIPEALPPPVR